MKMIFLPFVRGSPGFVLMQVVVSSRCSSRWWDCARRLGGVRAFSSSTRSASASHFSSWWRVTFVKGTSAIKHYLCISSGVACSIRVIFVIHVGIVSNGIDHSVTRPLIRDYGKTRLATYTWDSLQGQLRILSFGMIHHLLKQRRKAVCCFVA